MTITRMSRALSLAVLTFTLGNVAHAQTVPQPSREEDKPALAAFGNAFMITRRLYLEPVSPKTLIMRAVHGLATAPTLGSQEQQQILAGASNRMSTLATEDVMSLLRIFGATLDALHVTAGDPAMDGMLRVAVAGMLDGLDFQTRFLPLPLPTSALGEASTGLKLTKGEVCGAASWGSFRPNWTPNTKFPTDPAGGRDSARK